MAWQNYRNYEIFQQFGSVFNIWILMLYQNLPVDCNGFYDFEGEYDGPLT